MKCAAMIWQVAAHRAGRRTKGKHMTVTGAKRGGQRLTRSESAISSAWLNPAVGFRRPALIDAGARTSFAASARQPHQRYCKIAIDGRDQGAAGVFPSGRVHLQDPIHKHPLKELPRIALRKF